MIEKITIRKAKKEDLDLLYRWSNEPSVRAQSFSTSEISYEEHCNWFSQKLKDVDSIIYILEVDEISASVIRFDIKDKVTIGVSIDVDFRGKGLGSSFLRIGVEEYFKANSSPILAYIKKSNIASIKSFEKAGFSFFRNQIANNE